MLVIFVALFLHIVLQHGEVAVLADCIDVIPHRPKVSSPQEGLHLWMRFEYMFSGNTFDQFDRI